MVLTVFPPASPATIPVARSVVWPFNAALRAQCDPRRQWPENLGATPIVSCAAMRVGENLVRVAYQTEQHGVPACVRVDALG